MRRSVSDRPSRVEGYSRPSRSKASPRKRSSRDRLAAIVPSPPGSAARSAAQAAAPSPRAAVVSGVATSEQAGELAGLELAQPAEVGDARVLADADQRDPAGRHPERVQGRQDLGDLELVVQVGLEPEHVLAATVGGQRPVPLLEPARHLHGVDAVGVGDELGPHPPQPGVVEPTRHGPLVQHVGPGDRMPGQPGPAQQVDGDVAVGHVQRPGQPVAVDRGQRSPPLPPGCPAGTSHRIVPGGS